MSYLISDPETFTDDMIDGFVASNPELVQRVEGGVVRAAATPAGEVAVVIGGGSGHYPAFAGLVGRGLAHGAAMGNVFASPSAHQVYSVAKAAASDVGVLLTYGNYAGDVLNFDQAQERLIAEGIPCRTVVVTDDVSSADPDEKHRRRGVAGDFAVFRAAGWAAEQGHSLDEVWSLADRANERTRTLGVAFSGCTLPGAQAPLFTVAPGRMAVGMGIHGEPGIDEQDAPTASGLARLLVDHLLVAAPQGTSAAGGRVGVLLNGLGSVKSEELFVIYKHVAGLLGEAGLTVVAPEVGEFVTSFEMAGVSLTLFWLDDTLERAWTAPAATSAYKKSQPKAVPVTIRRGTPTVGAARIPPATSPSRAAAARVVDALRAVAAVIDQNADELGRLDAIAGDGDHGIGMQRGSAAAVKAAEQALRSQAGAGMTLRVAADAWADRAGGTSGALWGVGLRAVAEQLGDQHAPSADRVACGVRDAVEAISAAGKAKLGDKTMLDALLPFAERLSEQVAAGVPLGIAWRAASDRATRAAEDSAVLLPQIGRARTHHAKSLGTPDPGAVSLALAVTATAPVLLAEKEVAP